MRILSFQVGALGCRVRGLESRVEVEGSGFRVQGLGARVQGGLRPRASQLFWRVLGRLSHESGSTALQDMPVIFNAPHVDRITGNMQITQTRFGRFNVLLTFSRPNIRPPKKTTESR